MNINLENKKNILENLIANKKILEGKLMEIMNRTKNIVINGRKEENEEKDKIFEEDRILSDIKKENEGLLKKYTQKKAEIDEKIQKVENKLKLITDRYNLAKNDYDAKDKEYIEKFNYYQKLLDPSLLQKIPEIESDEENENNKIEELRGSKINQNKRSKKNGPKNVNNNLYSMTTISTGNNGNFNIKQEEKKSIKFNKKK